MWPVLAAMQQSQYWPVLATMQNQTTRLVCAHAKEKATMLTKIKQLEKENTQLRDNPK